MHRADIRQFIGLPSVRCRYAILLSCIRELIRVSLVEEGLSPTLLQEELWNISKGGEGFSGRALRKLPFQAYARTNGPTPLPLANFLSHLQETIAEEAVNFQKLQQKGSE